MLEKFKKTLFFLSFIFPLGNFKLFAEETMVDIGKPKDWGLDLQTPVTTVAKDVYDMHFFVLIIITLITAIIINFNPVKFEATLQIDKKDVTHLSKN